MQAKCHFRITPRCISIFFPITFHEFALGGHQQYKAAEKKRIRILFTEPIHIFEKLN